MNKDEHTISVVITAYNRPDYLKHSIISVLNQTHFVNEIIIIDDCSSEDLKSAVVDVFDDDRIIYIRKTKNLGVSDSRNLGINIASSKYIAFLDDDDEFLPNKIEKQLSVILSRNIIGCLCGYRVLETNKLRKFPESSFITSDDFKKENNYCGATGLVAERKFLKNTLFDATLNLGEDWDVFLRLSYKGSIYFISEPLYLYRMGSEDSLTRSAKNMSITDVEPRLMALNKNRKFLGETTYKKRASKIFLSYFLKKNNKMFWISESIKRFGLVPTVNVLISTFINKFIMR